QGCKPGSLYDDAAFGTPNGMALPFVFAAQLGPFVGGVGYVGDDPVTGDRLSIVAPGADPYGGMMQSRDLRTIASYRDPVYRAKADLVDLNLEYDLTDNLTFVSQTVYNEDQVYSFQDFNRFNTQPIFVDTSPLLMLGDLPGGGFGNI